MRFVGHQTGSKGKLGWMVRNGLHADDAMVAAYVNPDGKAMIASRKSRAGEFIHADMDTDGNQIVQLSRTGNEFKLSTARPGEPFEQVSLQEVDLNNEVFAGIFVTGSGGQAAKGLFSNLRIIKPFGEDQVAYEQYLGSRLEVLDLESGQRKVLLEMDHSIQAPNWTTDGKKLLYNSNGFMYSYDLESGEVCMLETGFANNNNNDHVLSFDGKQLAISHHDPEDNGDSVIYTLPAEGSSWPRRVTRKGLGPSYLHGWSPDGDHLVFTGMRKGKYDIYKVAIETGEEEQLTDTEGLDDGPEYTPDGRYIYFNSNRTGTMQIWRMRSDGSEQEQLTFDTWNDWFPHISPDGKNMVFLSYGTDVESGDHPFYKHVTLRMMKIDGAEPKIIAYLYGGQGTINVPSWSPDGKRIAFVSNSGPTGM